MNKYCKVNVICSLMNSTEGSFQSWCSAHGAVLEVRLISLLELNMKRLF